MKTNDEMINFFLICANVFLKFSLFSKIDDLTLLLTISKPFRLRRCDWAQLVGFLIQIMKIKKFVKLARWKVLEFQKEGGSKLFS